MVPRSLLSGLEWGSGTSWLHSNPLQHGQGTHYLPSIALGSRKDPDWTREFGFNLIQVTIQPLSRKA